MPRPKRTNPAGIKTTQNYRHPESDSPMRPDMGTQAQFRKKKPPVTYNMIHPFHHHLTGMGRTLRERRAMP